MRRLYQINHDTQRATDLGPATRPNLAAKARDRGVLGLTAHEIEPGHRWEIRNSLGSYSYEELVADEDLMTVSFGEREAAYRTLATAGHFAAGSRCPWFRPVTEPVAD